jgi:hypothetical protein
MRLLAFLLLLLLLHHLWCRRDTPNIPEYKAPDKSENRVPGKEGVCGDWKNCGDPGSLLDGGLLDGGLQ